MAHAYTPGLRVAEKTVVRERRILPLTGDVLVKVDDVVRSDAIVAGTELPGNVHSVNVVNRLSIAPEDIREYMLKEENDAIEKDEPLAENKPWIRWLKTTVPSPIKGTVESISSVTGQVLLREPPRPVEMRAYIDGRVVEVIENEGAVIESTATFIQGIFGVGGETEGILSMAVESPDEIVSADKITDDEGKILVGGSLITSEAIKKAEDVGVRGVIVGGFHDKNLKELLGYDLGVAITGGEDIDITLIITEGFGEIAMADRTFQLLKSRVGSKASINGATQIRAGVVRPEIIVAWPDAEAAAEQKSEADERDGMAEGDAIRIIREPMFGRIGKVKGLPSDLQQIETEAKVRVLEVQIDEETHSIVPRANVEIIQE